MAEPCLSRWHTELPAFVCDHAGTSSIGETIWVAVLVLLLLLFVVVGAVRRRKRE